mmetsp:Transcript_1389/g.1535  ORF Transcript_1389/g.1535 Transcript_1389/m.1535 type:complete len:670 (+) Transcript_1389:114-2123(+)|eukprot:CAMPEP_0184024098 /NCGR_PEP_ID=MMETSP0954-20121128/11831_1 /TAXON_ID=627963 /ORGANISM="Aplanochytrium sp, Strain PBS07" /LENGTH=669 /DNA_ID=CAMNT_0026307263 /DNA_START=204 /DNA_END=2213 /DNA_ORIENTATION=-
MGNQVLKQEEKLPEVSKKVLSQFGKDEIKLIKATFKDLAMRSPGNTIDRTTFLKHFPLPGLHGEQLFDIFDNKNTGVIDFSEFVSGFAKIFKSEDEKFQLIFKLYDIKKNGVITKKELEVMLMQIDTSILKELSNQVEETDKAKTIQTIIDDCFESCDLNHSGALSAEQFKLWVKKKPQVMEMLDSAFDFMSHPNASPTAPATPGKTGYGLTPRNSSTVSLTTYGLEDVSNLSKEGWLAKKGRRFQRLQNRLYRLQGNVMFYFASKTSKVPKGVILLTGCFVDPVEKPPSGPEASLYGFQIVTGVGGLRDVRTFYAKTMQERDAWVEILRSAGRDRKFSDVYVWKEKIGSGRFSNVYKCLSKAAGEEFAVKVIKKKQISVEENELLRGEIAILRLVNHRNVVKLIDVFESLEHLYIVMELLEGGELYHHIIGRSRFSEYEAAILLYQLAEGLDYLHTAGIVHRDLKPENILLKEKPKQGSRIDESFEIKLSDFGLSKLVAPEEIMKLPCGTISYVAPEVLSQKGYGIAADLWSVGVVMYLVLRGKLPFSSEDKDDIIEEILNDDLEWKNDKVWAQISPELVDLISSLLCKDPSQRLSAKGIQTHTWMVSMKSKFSSKAMDEAAPAKLKVTYPSNTQEVGKNVEETNLNTSTENGPVENVASSLTRESDS